MSTSTPPPPVVLAAWELRKRYGRVTVLDGVDITLHPREVLGVVGPNGAGKSTLLNLLSGVTPADSGSVHLGGQDVTRVSAAVRCRRGIGRSYQVPRPFGDMTVFENVLVAARFGAGLGEAAARRATLDALDRAGLAERANDGAGALRLLDRKRLELARALGSGPTVVLLDEIAGGLTEHELPALIATIGGLRDAGMSIIWIEHVVHALLAVADRLVCLTYGKIVAEGDPETVMASAEVRESYLGQDLEAAAGTGPQVLG